MPKKSFKTNVVGADKLFSANDIPTTDTNVENTVIQEKGINDQNNEKDNVNSNIKSNIKSNVYSNLLDSIVVPETTGANFTFYLDKEVANAVAQAAKKKKISRSKLVNAILRDILLGARQE